MKLAKYQEGETIFDRNKIDCSIGVTIRDFWNMILDKVKGDRNW